MLQNLTEAQIEKIVDATVSATKSYNAEQEYYEDDKTYSQRFADIQEQLLEKCGIKEITGRDEYLIDRGIAAREISDIINTDPQFSTLKKLIELDIVSVSPEGRNYPTVDFFHEKLDGGYMTVLSIEPQDEQDLIFKSGKVYSWDSEFCYPQPSIKDGLKRADATIRTLVSNWKAEEELANEEKQKSRSKLKM